MRHWPIHHAPHRHTRAESPPEGKVLRPSEWTGTGESLIFLDGLVDIFGHLEGNRLCVAGLIVVVVTTKEA